MNTTCRWCTCVMISLLVASLYGSIALAQEPTKTGLGVGDEVPISSMRCVVGQPDDKNTCLAGKYRAYRTISFYARSVEDQHLNALLKQVDGYLAKNTELRGYVLLLEGDQFDAALKDKIRAWAKQQEFTKLDVAIANSDPSKAFGIAKDTEVVVVYSEKLRVTFQRAFETGKFDESAAKELAGELAELSR